LGVGATGGGIVPNDPLPLPLSEECGVKTSCVGCGP
jgi:hypothetical protein